MRTTSSPSRERAVRPRRQPQRTCVGCRRTGDQSTFVRLVRGPAGVIVDRGGRRRESGRGAYLCRAEACWQRALRGSLAHALRVTLDETNRRELQEYAARFAAASENPGTATGESDAAAAPRTGEAEPPAPGGTQEEREL